MRPGATPEQVRSVVKDGLGGLTRGLHRINKPVIAAVNGWALAGGFETALACDIRIASEQARFGSFEARRGIPRLVNAAGVGVALHMLLTAEPIDAERALRWYRREDGPLDDVIEATWEIFAGGVAACP